IGHPLRGHQHEVCKLALLPDGRTLVSGAKDGTVCLWDTAAVDEDRTHVVLPTANFGFDLDEATLLFRIDPEGRVTRHEWGERFATSPVMETGGRVQLARFPRKRLMVTQSPEGRMRMWDLEARQQVNTAAALNSSTWYVRRTPLGHL